MLSLLRTRRSIRKYQNKPIPEALQKQLKEAVLRAPSSRSLNPWQFVFVQDKELLEKLARCKPHGSVFLQNAPLCVVVCADPAACDVWVEDTSIAGLILHLTAHALGLGSCWIQIRKRICNADMSASEYVKTCLDLPAHLEVEAIISIGYPDEVKKGHPEKNLLYSRIIEK
ncbi:MAG: nitroreductase family protein [Desulfoplanes sp.]